jgi:hypothetical protein
MSPDVSDRQEAIISLVSWAVFLTQFFEIVLMMAGK